MSTLSPIYSSPNQLLGMSLAGLTSASATASSYIDNTANGSLLFPGTVLLTNGSATVTMASISGTVTVTQGSQIVTAGTANFTPLSAGQVISFSSQPGVSYTILEVFSTTLLLLLGNYGGATSSTATLYTNGGMYFNSALYQSQSVQFAGTLGTSYVVSSITSPYVMTLTSNYTGNSTGATASVALTNGSVTVTGTGFTSFYAGQYVTFSGGTPTASGTYYISSIQSSTSLTLGSVYTGSTTSVNATMTAGGLQMYSLLNQFEDILVQFRVTVSSTPTAPAILNIYATGSTDGGTTYGEQVNGVSGPVTLTAPPNARLVGIINLGTTAAPSSNIGGSTLTATNGSSIVSGTSTTISSLLVGMTVTFSTGQVGVPYTIIAIPATTQSSATVTFNGTTTVTGSGTTFTTTFSVGQVVIQSTYLTGTVPYVITAIASNTSLTINTATGVGTGSATMTGQPTFVLNTPFTGTTTTTGALTAYVNKFSLPFSIAAAYGGTLPDHIVLIAENRSGQTLFNTAITPTAALTPGTNLVTASATLASFLTPGQMISFSSQLGVPYTVSSVSGTSLTLTTNYTGAGASTASIYIEAFTHTWQGTKRQFVDPLESSSTSAITAITGDVTATGPGSVTGTVNSISGASSIPITATETVLNSSGTNPVNSIIYSQTTTNSTSTTAVSIAMAASSASRFIVNVLGVDTGGAGDLYSADYEFLVQRAGSSAATLNPSTPAAYNILTNGSGSSMNSSVALSTNTLQISVTGLASTTIHWSIDVTQKVVA